MLQATFFETEANKELPWTDKDYVQKEIERHQSLGKTPAIWLGSLLIPLHKTKGTND